MPSLSTPENKAHDASLRKQLGAMDPRKNLPPAEGVPKTSGRLLRRGCVFTYANLNDASIKLHFLPALNDVAKDLTTAQLTPPFTASQLSARAHLACSHSSSCSRTSPVQREAWQPAVKAQLTRSWLITLEGFVLNLRLSHKTNHSESYSQ